MVGVTITKMHIAEHGELEARISLNGETIPVTRSNGGTWKVLRDGRPHELLRPYAEALQVHARERGLIDRRFRLVRNGRDST